MQVLCKNLATEYEVMVAVRCLTQTYRYNQLSQLQLLPVSNGPTAIVFIVLSIAVCIYDFYLCMSLFQVNLNS